MLVISAGPQSLLLQKEEVVALPCDVEEFAEEENIPVCLMDYGNFEGDPYLQGFTDDASQFVKTAEANDVSCIYLDCELSYDDERGRYSIVKTYTAVDEGNRPILCLQRVYTMPCHVRVESYDSSAVVIVDRD